VAATLRGGCYFLQLSFSTRETMSQHDTRHMTKSLSLRALASEFAVVRFPPDAGLPWWAASSSELLSHTRSVEETSIVCEARCVPGDVQAERGFRALRVAGTIPFQATGILASLAAPLAAANVPVFAISTFDTDYVLVPGRLLSTAVEALRGAGHSVKE
jgi:hypothetical protein